eukprot:c3827_g1_i1.p1 GENE.c3827_g1_i1~~c3827_g1_i1.p1  ORF type:complete len:299 (-),score=49.08 c3827_g1_i1:34-930(-)
MGGKLSTNPTMSTVHAGEAENQSLLEKKDQTCKYVSYSVCALIVLGIVLSIIFIPNPSTSVCGNRDIANSFVLHEIPLSVSSFRHNVDVLVPNPDDANKNIILGQYYRKLISEDRTFRYADNHDHIAATMVRTSTSSGADYKITACHSNDTYHLVQKSTRNNNTWDSEFELFFSNGAQGEQVSLAASARQSISENTARLSSDDTVYVTIVRGTKKPGWEVTISEDSEIPAYVAGFFALAVTDTAQFADVDMSASPSPSSSVTPSISFSASPSPSNSASSASPVSAMLMLALAMLVKLW